MLSRENQKTHSKVHTSMKRGDHHRFIEVQHFEVSFMVLPLERSEGILFFPRNLPLIMKISAVLFLKLKKKQSNLIFWIIQKIT